MVAVSPPRIPCLVERRCQGSAEQPKVDKKLFDLSLELLESLHRHKVEYILVGGLALGSHGLVRATEDIDLFLETSADNVDRLKAALRQVWDDDCIDEITHEDLAGDYPTIRYGPPGDDFIVDLLGRLGESFSYSDLEAETKVFRGIQVRVATPRLSTG